jgi:hypothetical protein
MFVPLSHLYIDPNLEWKNLHVPKKSPLVKEGLIFNVERGIVPKIAHV